MATFANPEIFFVHCGTKTSDSDFFPGISEKLTHWVRKTVKTAMKVLIKRSKMRERIMHLDISKLVLSLDSTTTRVKGNSTEVAYHIPDPV